MSKLCENMFRKPPKNFNGGELAEVGDLVKVNHGVDGYSSGILLEIIDDSYYPSVGRVIGRYADMGTGKRKSQWLIHMETIK